MNKRKGISLIVLVITILVMIILAGVVVVSLQKNNPIEKAKEATFKQSLAQIGEELEMFCLNEKAQNSEFNKESLHASKNNLAFNTKKESSGKNIYDIIPSLKDSKYKNQVEVIQGNLFYRTPDKKEIPWLRELGIHFTGIVTGNVIIEGDTLVGVSPDYVNTGTLVIPENVTKIAEGAFAGCENVTDIILPSKLTKIENNTFTGCSELVSITIPDTVTEIGANAFKLCHKLKKINMPASLTKIGYAAFHECVSIESVDFTNTKLQIIEPFAFYYCTSLSNLKFNDGLKSIGNQSFQAIKVKDIVIPNSVEVIRSSAFIFNHILETIRIGANTTIEPSIIRGCTNLKSFNVVKSSKYEVIDNVLYAFSERGERILQEVPASVSSINFPADLKIVEYGAFLDNKLIKTITFPEGLVSLCGRTFEGCDNLNTLVLPKSIQEISARIFENTRALQNVSFTNGDTSNGKYKLDNGVLIDDVNKIIVASIDNKSSYTIPQDIVRIGGFAFTGCTKLQNVDFSKATNLNSFGEYVFLSCHGLVNFTIPGKVKSIGANVFNNCVNLENVTLEEGVIEVPMLTFNNCVKLKKVSIPSTCINIDGQAFRGTKNFGNVVISSANTKFKVINQNIYTDNGTTLVAVTSAQSNIVIPEGVVKLGKDSLRGNTLGITSVSLPTSLKEIGDFAFEDLSAIKRVVIPSGVTKIGRYAFDSTPNLSEIIINKPEGSIQGAPWGATHGMKAIIWQ